MPALASLAPSPHAAGLPAAVGLAALIVHLATPAAAPAPTAPTPAPPMVASPALPASPPAAPPAPAPNDPSQARPAPLAPGQLLLAFPAGGATYVKLADLRGEEDTDGRSRPRHGRARLVSTDGVEAAIAAVAARDVPADLRAWRGQEVVVEGGCRARIAGFAVIARATGEPIELDATAWTAAGVLKAGHAVLAGRLDRCQGRFASDARLPSAALPVAETDEQLAAAGRAALLASEPARAVQREWDAQSQAAGAPLGAWSAGAKITSEVVRHPRTGELFVSVHGHVDHGCGDPSANLWALYRVDAGALVPLWVRALETIETIDALVDVDDDGAFELLGRSWLGNDVAVTRGSGELLDQLRVPFFGCPC